MKVKVARQLEQELGRKAVEGISGGEERARWMESNKLLESFLSQSSLTQNSLDAGRGLTLDTGSIFKSQKTAKWGISMHG